MVGRGRGEGTREKRCGGEQGIGEEGGGRGRGGGGEAGLFWVVAISGTLCRKDTYITCTFIAVHISVHWVTFIFNI